MYSCMLAAILLIETRTASACDAPDRRAFIHYERDRAHTLIVATGCFWRKSALARASANAAEDSYPGGSLRPLSWAGKEKAPNSGLFRPSCHRHSIRERFL